MLIALSKQFNIMLRMGNGGGGFPLLPQRVYILLLSGNLPSVVFTVLRSASHLRANLSGIYSASLHLNVGHNVLVGLVNKENYKSLSSNSVLSQGCLVSGLSSMVSPLGGLIYQPALMGCHVTIGNGALHQDSNQGSNSHCFSSSLGVKQLDLLETQLSYMGVSSTLHE